MDLNQLPQKLHDWMTARFLQPILDQEGGWEYFVQIDFPAWLDASSGLQHDIRREVSGVVRHVTLDWLINEKSDDPPTGVQIKAQTHKAARAAFLAEVRKDIDKYRHPSAPLNKMLLVAAIDGVTSSQLKHHYEFNELFNFADTVEFLTRQM